MPSGTESPSVLRLQPNARIERPLSVSEYYHASIGASPRTMEPPRQAIFVLEGDGPAFEAERWQRALDLACAANPGTRLRMVGNSWGARWQADGEPARLRVIERTDWDGLSSEGAGFIDGTSLSLEVGQTVELILVNRSPRGPLVILRALHAVMDGRGGLHFLADIFRALRGEAPEGTNAGFSDVDLMLRAGARGSTARRAPTDWLTGAPQGDEQGDIWRRVKLETRGHRILSRIAGIMAEYMHRHSDRPALIAVPVDLRRHLPGLKSTGNFSNMIAVPLAKGEGADAFRRKLEAVVAGREDAYFPRALNLFKLLPRSWIDRLLSRTSANYRTKRPFETAVISNIGRIDPRTFSCDGFELKGYYVLPPAGSVFSVLTTVGDRIDLVLNMPKILASNGRFDDFVAYLQRRLKETDPT